MNNLKDKNKDGFIFLDKILNHNHINSPSRKNIYNLRNKYILITEESKKSLSKDKTKEKKKRKIDNNLLNKKKDLNIISYDNQRNNLNLFNKNTISRNYNNKISSSVKRNNNMKSITNNNMKSISNPINKSHIDKNIYLKKKVDDVSKNVNSKKIINLNRKYNMNHIINQSNNHNYLVNLLLGNKKYDKNSNVRLYNLINKKSIKNLETNTKSSFSSKSSDFPNRASNICNISNIDKKNIPKPSISRNNINFYNPKESPMINHSSAVAKKVVHAALKPNSSRTGSSNNPVSNGAA
jgi:hypothetical protein